MIRRTFSQPHPYLPSDWGPEVRADIPSTAPQLPDVNPAEQVVARLRRRFFDSLHAAGQRAPGELDPDDGKDGQDGVNGLNGPAGIAGLRSRITMLETMISGATLEIVCNEDGTITGNLEWGS